MKADDVTGSKPGHPPDRRFQRRDERVVVGLVEVDQRDQVLLRRVRLRRQHAVPARRPAPPAPVLQQIADVDRQRRRVVRRVRPPLGLRIHLQPTGSRLAIEDGDGAEVGVRADAELSRLGLAHHADRRVVVDVHRPGRPDRQRGPRVDRQPERVREEREQVVGHPAHRSGVLGDQPLQRRHLGGPDVGREPDPVDVRVAGRGLRAQAVALLEVGRRLGALGVGVGLGARPDPAVPTDRHAVALLDVVGLREELPAGGTHRRREARVDAVPGDQDETRALQALVHLGGHRVRGGSARLPA